MVEKYCDNTEIVVWSRKRVTFNSLENLWSIGRPQSAIIATELVFADDNTDQTDSKTLPTGASLTSSTRPKRPPPPRPLTGWNDPIRVFFVGP